MTKKDKNDVQGFIVTATPTGGTPQIQSFPKDTPSNEITGSTTTYVSVEPKKDVEKIDKLNNWIDSTRELMNVFGEDIDLEIEKTEEVDVEFKRDIKVKVGFLGDLSGGEIGVDYVLVPKKTRRKEKITIKGKKRLK